jgi:predicted permease
MRIVRTWRGWLLRLFGRGTSIQFDRELDAELQGHLQLHVDDLLRSGLSEAEARRQALVALGGFVKTQEEVRDQRGVPMLAQFTQDVRHSIRLMRRQTAFSVAAIVVLALGIGANTAVFGLVDGLLLRSLPVERPSELVRVTGRGEEVHGHLFFERLRDENRSLSGVFAYWQLFGPTLIETDRGLESLLVVAASEDYFSVLGVPPEAGRTFGRGTSDWQSEPVAVVSHAFARQRADNPASVLGSRVHYLTRTFTVVGVMPPQFFGVEHPTPDIWVPLRQTEPPDSPTWTRARFLKVMGRLRDGVALDEAAAEAAVIGGANREIGMEPGANGFSDIRDRFSRPVLILQALVALVLLVACANLANLLLARGASRQREIAIRLSVGASRGRLLRQFATESLVLSVVGGAAALAVAWWLSWGIASLIPPALAGAAAQLELRLDTPLLIFAGGTSLVASLLFGVAPALLTTASRTRGLRSGAGDRRGRTTSRGLVVGAVALSAALVVVSGLFVRTLYNLRTGDNGFAPSDVVVAEVQMPPVPQPRPTLAQYEEVLARLRTVPGTDAAGFSRIGQLTGGFIEHSITRTGEVLTQAEVDQRPMAIEQRVSPDFLRAMGTAILEGRDVSDSDTDAAPQVALVNEAFVRAYLDNRSPIGQRFSTSYPGEFAIVGLVKNTRWVDLREDDRPMFYRPSRQAAPIGATFAIRSGRPAGAVADDVRRAGAEAGVRFKEIVPFADMVNRTLVTERLLAYLSAGVGTLALLIVGVGLYGLLSYTVGQRTREIGVRRALGATNVHIQWIVVRDSLVLLVVGLTMGFGVVVIAAPLLAAVLFSLTATDVGTFTATAAILVAVTVLAASIPAYRASRVEPVVALRAE